MVTDYGTPGSGGFARVSAAVAIAVALGSVGAAPTGSTVDPLNPQFDRTPRVATEFAVYGTVSSGGGSAAFSRCPVVNNTMEPLKQNTARNLMVLLVQSADHITGLPGLTLTITTSKDGAAFATITPTVTDRGDGWYNLALTTGHTDTLGDLAFHITGASADPCDFKLPVELDRTGASVASVVGNVGGNLVGTLSVTERAAIADALLDRDMSTGTDSGSTTVRTVRQALRFLRNKWSIAGGTLSVKKENDSTESWSATVTQTSGDPVSTVDPD